MAQAKAEEQAAIVLAAQALAQAEAQAELHKQLQQRLADAQAASVQEAEREKRKVQSVTLKGAKLAFNAPKAAGKSTPAQTGLLTSLCCRYQSRDPDLICFTTNDVLAAVFDMST